ncbi:MAG: aspartate/glutamate racemase family protein [Actinomycetota bacterium]|nr:aspartate/glutamate racemase family protein [Actinomycetota bacterium]
MRTIGLIGGMSWESSAEYYRLINESARRRLGGFHSAQSLMFSVDFDEIEELQRTGRWDEAGDHLADAARRLERGGAGLVVLCTNTMHRLAEEVARAIAIPLLHIADATGEELRARDMATVGLLGTRYTMEQDFYRGRLEDRYGLEVLVPDHEGRALVHDVIYGELVLGRVEDSSRIAYREVMRELAGRGAEAIILGCTEIGLLVGDADAPVPVFDTTRIHAEKAVEWALA